MRDPYSVLGVPRGADADTIKKTYKKLAREFHPDVNKDPKAQDRFKEINAAYDVLGDDQKRKLFDQYGEAATRPGFDPSKVGGFGGGPGGPGGFGGFGFNDAGGVDLEDLLGSMFGAGAARGPRRGADQAVRVEVSPLLAFTGGEIPIDIRRPQGAPERLKIRIPAGVSDGGKLRLKGQGNPPPGGGPCGDLVVHLAIDDHPLLRRIGDDLEMDVPLTVLEALRGAAITVPTPTGDVKVNVPPGVQSGQKLRLRGKGIQKSPATDLFLVLRPQVPKSADPEVIAAAERIEAAYDGDLRAGLSI